MTPKLKTEPRKFLQAGVTGCQNEGPGIGAISSIDSKKKNPTERPQWYFGTEPKRKKRGNPKIIGVGGGKKKVYPLLTV